MKFTIEIDCDNAAFEDDATVEIARILRDIADQLEPGRIRSYRLRDINGNHVGQAVLHD